VVVVNVQNLKTSSEALWRALDAKREEAESLRAQCERLKAQQIK